MYEKLYTLSPLYKKFEQITEDYEAMLPQDERVSDLLEIQDQGLANQSHYLRIWGKFPVYQNTDLSYFQEGEALIQDIMEELQRAQRFIFLELHVCEDSVVWKAMVEALQERAAQGVEVRVLYDGTGSKARKHEKLVERMRHKKIQCKVFHPRKGSSKFLNYSDYRKTLVIDGRVAYTGDYEFTNEQFQLEKEKQMGNLAGLKLTGDGVRSITFSFLKMWNVSEQNPEDPVPYLLKTAYRAAESGFVQPFATNPMMKERIGMMVYLNMVRNARRYIYLTIPDGISDELQQELVYAAKRGVHVYVIVPKGKGWKQSSMQDSAALFRVFGYKQGSFRMRMMICDNQTAVLGNIHTSASFYHHMFENGCWFALCRTVIAMKNDFEKMLSCCDDIL